MLTLLITPCPCPGAVPQALLRAAVEGKVLSPFVKPPSTHFVTRMHTNVLPLVARWLCWMALTALVLAPWRRCSDFSSTGRVVVLGTRESEILNASFRQYALTQSQHTRVQVC